MKKMMKKKMEENSVGQMGRKERYVAFGLRKGKRMILIKSFKGMVHKLQLHWVLDELEMENASRAD